MQIKKSPRDSEFPRIPTFENADYEVENSAQMEDRAPGAFNVRPSRPAARKASSELSTAWNDPSVNVTATSTTGKPSGTS